MRLQSLSHLIEVVRAVARPNKVCVLGSASLLPAHPELGEVGHPKDLDLLRAMLRLEIVKPERLRQHYQQTPLGEREAVTAGRNLALLLRELGCP